MSRFMPSPFGRTRSIGFKAAIATAVPVLIGIAALVALELKNLRDSVYEQAEMSTSDIVQLMSNQMAGGVKWGKADVVDKVYADLVAGSDNELSNLLVLNRDGAVVTSFDSPSLASFGALASLTEASAERLAAGEVVTGWEGGHLVVLAPIMPGGERLGTLATAWDQSRLESLAADKMMKGALFGLLLAAMVVGVVALFLSRSVTRPIREVTDVMTALAAGDNQVTVPYVGRSDEVGRMAQAVETFKQAAVEKLRVEAEAAERRREAESERAASEESRRAASEEQEIVVGEIGRGLSRLSDGDLGYRIARAFPANYEQLKADFNGAMAQLEEAMRTIAASTTAIRSGTGEISQASDDLSRRTEQQAASLEETAAALDEITATVKRTADGAGHARDVVGRTTSLAEQSGAVVGDAVKAMSGIEASSKEISQIIGVIDEIAFQTNLLALNAGVEAARAGDAGKGFAVVASEVRALAQRSAEAAKEIKGLIDNSTAQVDQGVDLVARTGEALKEIAAQVAEINAIVRDISASAQEQATGLAEVNTAVNQMDQVTQQNAAMVEQQTAASHTLSSETGELVRLVSRFRLTGEARKAHAAEPAEARRPAPARPARRPATHGNAALRMEPANEDQGWEEF
ncbi:methyl-accepting chemotaxis protein [Lutibaculum baratangense]|uniref:Methyl-accepting chemotaxis protein n=1 Tax=Lutibaculum baratangense AMV1 TaxID=631454 RepID=V4RDH2_9HYPH|nr:HAMP domain-containing methyl-accepting chemotaxis protein [Lutibaculum baratangense]ESR24211.1 Methyl-accepting chemotaxis protein [Lutibaculum baratangense AMV1]